MAPFIVDDFCGKPWVLVIEKGLGEVQNHQAAVNHIERETLS